MDDLSSDQYYAYRICSAVMLGSVDTNLEFLEVGGVNHSRWLTLECRILRFYVALEKPTSNLALLWYHEKNHFSSTLGSIKLHY